MERRLVLKGERNTRREDKDFEMFTHKEKSLEENNVEKIQSALKDNGKHLEKYENIEKH